MNVSPVKSAGQASFETVWNRQTGQNSTEQTSSENKRTTSKSDDAVVRNSLKAKSPVKEEKAVDEADGERNDLQDMDPKAWEAAMEVLGAAAEKLIQQIAESFGMEPEEVEAMMSELSMDSVELLQTDKLAELLLMAGGAEDMTALLTDGELYQQFQDLMQRAQTLLNECSETLQMDAEALVDAMTEETQILAGQEDLPIEITLEAEDVAEDGTPDEKVQDAAKNAEVSTQNVAEQQPESTKMGEQTTDRNGQQGEHDTNHTQDGNLLLQHLKETQFTPQTEQTGTLSSVWDADTQDIMRQIMDFMRIQLKPEMSDLEMQLHPAHLGTLQIHVASKDGAITAQFVAQNESVKAALEGQMIQLKENFAEAGVKVDAIEVLVQTHEFEQNLEQGRGREQNEPRRSRTRRIQLDGPLTMEEIDSMGEEEQLAAQMMEANGNTVDYTA